MSVTLGRQSCSPAGQGMRARLLLLALASTGHSLRPWLLAVPSAGLLTLCVEHEFRAFRDHSEHAHGFFSGLPAGVGAVVTCCPGKQVLPPGQDTSVRDQDWSHPPGGELTWISLGPQDRGSLFLSLISFFRGQSLQREQRVCLGRAGF